MFMVSSGLRFLPDFEVGFVFTRVAILAKYIHLGR